MTTEALDASASPRRRIPRLPERVQSILSWLAIALVGALVAVLVLAALAPRLFGIHFVMVAGGSMEPTIPFGSLAVMRDVDGADVEVGDIILFPAPGDSDVVVTHRVSAIDESGSLVTWGDANPREDNWLTDPADVRQEYLFAIPGLGSAVQRLGSPIGYMLVVLVPGLIIVGGEVRSIIRTINSGRKPAQDAPLTQ